MTYLNTLLLAFDMGIAAVFFNRVDFTVSSMCYLISINKDAPLKLNKLQRGFLAWLGPILDKIQKGHLEKAAQGDVARGQYMIDTLTK